MMPSTPLTRSPRNCVVIIHHTQVIELVVHILITAVSEPDIVAELMHQGAGLLPQCAPRDSPGTHCDNKIMSRDTARFPA